MDPVVHGAEFHPISPGRLDPRGNGVLLGASSPEGHLVQLSITGKSKFPGSFPGRILGFPGIVTSHEDREQHQERKEASPPKEGRPRNPRGSPPDHSAVSCRC